MMSRICWLATCHKYLQKMTQCLVYFGHPQLYMLFKTWVKSMYYDYTYYPVCDFYLLPIQLMLFSLTTLVKENQSLHLGFRIFSIIALKPESWTSLQNFQKRALPECRQRLRQSQHILRKLPGTGLKLTLQECSSTSVATAGHLDRDHILGTFCLDDPKFVIPSLSYSLRSDSV